jgi:hypothetical protein
MVLDRNYSYPDGDVRVFEFSRDSFRGLIPVPTGFVAIDYDWPPQQIEYLSLYLERIGCKTIVAESHYLDRDYVHDHALFYAKSFRSYPNFCTRLHFFSEKFELERWKESIKELNGGAATISKSLQDSYRGFCVVRPLPGCPIGRTIIPPPPASAGLTDTTTPLRPYFAHVAGIEFKVSGLPFQQQDRGVSACATTALWTSIHSTAHRHPAPSRRTSRIDRAGSHRRARSWRAAARVETAGTKKPGAVSRPGTLREFQFHEYLIRAIGSRGLKCR